MGVGVASFCTPARGRAVGKIVQPARTSTATNSVGRSAALRDIGTMYLCAKFFGIVNGRRRDKRETFYIELILSSFRQKRKLRPRATSSYYGRRLSAPLAACAAG